jgi:hypothetical protein
VTTSWTAAAAPRSGLIDGGAGRQLKNRPTVAATAETAGAGGAAAVAVTEAAGRRGDPWPVAAGSCNQISYAQHPQ